MGRLTTKHYKGSVDTSRRHAAGGGGRCESRGHGPSFADLLLEAPSRRETRTKGLSSPVDFWEMAQDIRRLPGRALQCYKSAGPSCQSWTCSSILGHSAQQILGGHARIHNLVTNIPERTHIFLATNRVHTLPKNWS